MLRTRVDLNAIVRAAQQEAVAGRRVSSRGVDDSPAARRDRRSQHASTGVREPAVERLQVLAHAGISATSRWACQQNGPSEAVIFVRDNGVGFDMAYANEALRRVSTACIGPRSSRAPASGLPTSSGLSPATAGGSGRRAHSTRAPRSTSRCPPSRSYRTRRARSEQENKNCPTRDSPHEHSNLLRPNVKAFADSRVRARRSGRARPRPAESCAHRPTAPV